MGRVFILSCQDLSGVGGPMGSETVRTKWQKICSSLSIAKSLAHNDFAVREGKGQLTWSWNKSSVWCSQDLGHSQYWIKKVSFYE